MTFALLAALTLTFAGSLWLMDRKDKRHARAVADLCQRIQAPEAAVIQHATEHARPDEPEPYPDEELVDEEVQEAILRLERMEAEKAPWLS